MNRFLEIPHGMMDAQAHTLGQLAALFDTIPAMSSEACVQAWNELRRAGTICSRANFAHRKIEDIEQWPEAQAYLRVIAYFWLAGNDKGMRHMLEAQVALHIQTIAFVLKAHQMLATWNIPFYYERRRRLEAWITKDDVPLPATDHPENWVQKIISASLALDCCKEGIPEEGAERLAEYLTEFGLQPADLGFTDDELAEWLRLATE